MVYTYSRYEDNKFKLPEEYKIIAFYIYVGPDILHCI